MPQKIQNPGVAQALTRAFNLVGRVRPALDEVIIPVVSIGDLAAGSAPAAVRAAVGHASQAAVAGEYAVIRLEAPPSILVRIRAIHAWSNTDGRMYVNFGSSVAAPASVSSDKGYTDPRVPADTPAVTIGHDTYAAILADYQASYGIEASSTDNEDTHIEPSHWLFGSDELYAFVEIGFGAANASFRVTVEWEEYLLP